MKKRSTAHILIVLGMTFALSGCSTGSEVYENQTESLPTKIEVDVPEVSDSDSDTDTDSDTDSTWVSITPETDEADSPATVEDDINVSFSHDDRSFTVNGKTYDIAELNDGSTAVMDVWQTGDWIIADCHINPHFGMYYLVNIYTGNIEKRIRGANLTWCGDDITTAVYSVMGDVYNFKDHIVYSGSDDDEIYDIKYNTSGDEITIETFGGNTYTEYVDNDDTAMYQYADYLRYPTEDRWNEFMRQAPENAVAFVMDTPPEEVAALLPHPEEFSTDTPECFCVVSLEDDTSVRLAQGEMDIDTWEFKPSYTAHSTTLNRGESCGYRMVIPEGLPSYAVYFIAGNRRGIIPVSILTGMTDRCGEFVVSE